MAKFRVKNGCGLFHCPGCKCAHRVPVNGLYSWAWNGSENTPTLEPSLNYNMMDPATHCHSFVTEGRIQFLPDCFHALAGLTVDIPEWV